MNEYSTESEAGGTGGKILLSVVMQQMTQQNNRLLMLLWNNSPVTKQRHSGTENGLTFDRWFSKYEDLFWQDGRRLNNAAKIRVLLHSLIDSRGLRPDPIKIEATFKLPPPADESGVRSFLGAINYYVKFFSNMRMLRYPLDIGVWSARERAAGSIRFSRRIFC